NCEYGCRHVSDLEWPRETFQPKRPPVQARQTAPILWSFALVLLRQRTVAEFRGEPFRSRPFDRMMKIKKNWRWVMSDKHGLGAQDLRPKQARGPREACNCNEPDSSL